MSVNSSVACPPEWGRQDDFWPTPEPTCYFSLLTRYSCLLILLVAASINVSLAMVKLRHLRPFNRWPLLRPQRSALLVLCHYLANCGLVGVLLGADCRLHNCISAVLLAALATLFGCLSHANRLLDVLVIALKAQGFTAQHYKPLTRAIRYAIAISSCGGATIWLAASVAMYNGIQPEWMFRLMWLGITLTLLTWAIGFTFYGHSIIDSLNHTQGARQANHKSLDHIKTLMRLLMGVTIAVCCGTALIVLVKWIYIRTIYFFAILGSGLSVADIVHLGYIKKRRLGAGTSSKNPPPVGQVHRIEIRPSKNTPPTAPGGQPPTPNNTDLRAGMMSPTPDRGNP